MPLDPRLQADTLAWFRKAMSGLRCARIGLAASPPAPEDALFHRQQAIEKALKGFLAWHAEPFPKTHDLGRLGSLIEYTRCPWLTWHPGGPVEPALDEALDALRPARKLAEALPARLPDSGRP